MAWKENQFKEHPVHSTLARTIHLLESVDFQSDDTDENAKFSRAKKLLRLLQVNLENIDPDLINAKPLNEIGNTLTGMQPSLESAAMDVNTINVELDGILDSENGWILRKFPERDKAIMGFMRSMGDSEKKFTESLDILKSILKQEKNNAQELSKRISQQKEESESSLTNWKERGEQQLADWLKQFSSDQGTRQKDFSDSQESRQENFSQWLNGFKQDSANNMDAVMAELSNIEKDSREKHSEILDLHGLTAGDSVGAGYIEDAKKESHFANKWRVGSVFALIFAAVVPILAIFGNWYGTGSLKIEVPLGVMPITFILIGLSTYCAFQSTKHRNMEFLNRRLSLEMKAIGPYIESLDEPTKVKIKAALIPVFFGSREFLKKDAKISDENVLLSSIKELINKITSSG